MTRSKQDVPHELECPRCEGIGYTPATAPRFEDKTTVQLGSGCERCLGTGRLERK